MSRLIERYSSFDSDIQSLGAILLGLEDPPPWNLKEELLKPVKSSNLDLPEYGQPLLAAIQIALVNLLASLGVVPDAVIGFSSGEMAAAYASCAITAKEAIIAAYYRGQVVKKLDRKRGGMAAIGLGHNQVLPFLKPGVTVGCDPSPNFVVLSGDKDVLEIVCEDIRKVNIGVFNYRLPSSVAYHSRKCKLPSHNISLDSLADVEQIICWKLGKLTRHYLHPIFIASLQQYHSILLLLQS